MIEGVYYAKAAALFGAALVMGLGSIAPALAQGMIGKQACKSVGDNPDNLDKIRSVMMLSMVLVETAALYCLVIAVLLIFMT